MNAKRYAPFVALVMALAMPCAEGAVKAKDVPPLLVTDAGKTVTDAQMGADEIVVCDQLKQTIDIYDAGGLQENGVVAYNVGYH